MIHFIRKLFVLLVLLAAWSGTTHMNLVAQTETTGLTLPPGTMVKARLIEELNSSRTSKDDRFDLRILFATHEGKRLPLPRETRISGKILSAKSALRERAGLLTFRIDQLVFPDEKAEPLQGEIQLLAVKDVTTESNGPELTLRGRVDESNTMTIQSSTSNTPPPSNVDDLSHGDLKSPDKKQNNSRGSLELTKKKGHDFDLPTGTIFNIKILDSPPPGVPAKPASAPSH